MAVQLKGRRAKLGESMGEEEAAPKTIWEVLERTGVLGAQDSSGDTGRGGSVKGFGEVWSFMGESWDRSWHRGCRRDVNKEGSRGSQEDKCPETHCCSEGEGNWRLRAAQEALRLGWRSLLRL